jgi:hypothetical protein
MGRLPGPALTFELPCVAKVVGENEDSLFGYPGGQGNQKVEAFDTRSHLYRRVQGLI